MTLDPTDEPSTDDRSRRRRRVLVVIVSVMAVSGLLALGWGAAVAFRSPEQVAASRTAPSPDPVTAAVAEGSLTDSVSTNVVLENERQDKVPFVLGSDRDVVTKAPMKSGDSVQNFAVVAEVNGGPRFAIGGEFPFYRSLTVGDRGPDVKQIQVALQDAGYKVGADGVFGSSTAAAVSKVYRNAGYSVPNVEADDNDDDGAPTTDADEPARDSDGKSQGTSPVDDPPAPKKVVSIPASDLLVVPHFPAQLGSVPRVGTVLDDSSAVMASSGDLVATAEVEAATALRIKKGMSAELTGPESFSESATVKEVSVVESDGGGAQAADSAGGGEAEKWKVVLETNSMPDPKLIGQEALAVITVDIAAPDSLLVPSIAVIPGGSGNPHVLKKADDGSFTEVEVRELGTFGGRSAIEPVSPEQLSVDDQVKVR